MPSKAALAALEKLSAQAKHESIPEAEKAEVLAKARARVDKATSSANVFIGKAENSITRFDIQELKCGRQLGEGGFCQVFQIDKICLTSEEAARAEEEHRNQIEEHHTRKYMEKTCIRNERDCRYAIKKLSDRTKSKKDQYLKGLVDIAIEARILAAIQHENIIKVRAFATCDYFDDDFFIMMDRLQITLDKKLGVWKETLNQNTGLRGVFNGGKIKVQELLEDRLIFATELAEAMAHLHGMNIIYRDLKPDNIGFDVRGTIKLFDFGLAKEIDLSTKDENGTYKLTGYTGSPLYMAPEIALNKPYNFSADVYSFGILLWQMIALKSPFEKLTIRNIINMVAKKNHRPPCDAKWTASLSELLRSCWSPDIGKRPSFQNIISELRIECSGGRSDGPGPQLGVIDCLDISKRSFTNLMTQLKLSR